MALKGGVDLTGFLDGQQQVGLLDAIHSARKSPLHLRKMIEDKGIKAGVIRKVLVKEPPHRRAIRCRTTWLGSWQWRSCGSTMARLVDPAGL